MPSRVSKAWSLTLRKVTRAVASPWASLAVAALLLAWFLAGLLVFRFQEPWALGLNAAGWAVALLMLFILQHAQRRDTLAIQIKLDELVAAARGASNEAVRAERLHEEELEAMRAELERRMRRGEAAPGRGPRPPKG